MNKIFDGIAYFVLGALLTQVIWWLILGTPPIVLLICKGI